MKIRLLFAVACLSLGLIKGNAVASPEMVYIFNGPESESDRRYDFQWEILRTALEKTKDTHGPYRMEPSIPMTEARQTFELTRNSGLLTVMHLGTTRELEKKLTPVRIPVDKNLSGYMVYLIKKEDQPRYTAIDTLDDLRKLSIGQGKGWLDVEILRSGGFDVVTGPNYDGLFAMLLNRRFDAFQRSVTEVIDEYDARKNNMPDLHIENTLLFYYPLPMYFWFAKSPEGRRLATRAEDGMMAMINDGSYDKIFRKYKSASIERLRLNKRKIFRINNPLLPSTVPFDDKRLWFVPETER